MNRRKDSWNDHRKDGRVMKTKITIVIKTKAESEGRRKGRTYRDTEGKTERQSYR